jgi:hypothetical protein
MKKTKSVFDVRALSNQIAQLAFNDLNGKPIDPLSPEMLKEYANATGNYYPTHDMIENQNKIFEALYPLTPEECYPISQEGIIAQVEMNGGTVPYNSSNNVSFDEAVKRLKNR